MRQAVFGECGRSACSERPSFVICSIIWTGPGTSLPKGSRVMETGATRAARARFRNPSPTVLPPARPAARRNPHRIRRERTSRRQRAAMFSVSALGAGASHFVGSGAEAAKAKRDCFAYSIWQCQCTVYLSDSGRGAGAIS